MPKMKKYPGLKETERERKCSLDRDTDDQPDFIGNAPNYDKFDGMTVEEVLIWLNID